MTGGNTRRFDRLEGYSSCFGKHALPSSPSPARWQQISRTVSFGTLYASHMRTRGAFGIPLRYSAHYTTQPRVTRIRFYEDALHRCILSSIMLIQLYGCHRSYLYGNGIFIQRSLSTYVLYFQAEYCAMNGIIVPRSSQVHL